MISSYYGPSASGKTTFAKAEAISLAKQGKKIVYLDTENGFSVERVKQLAGKDFEKALNNILLIKIKSFKDQQLKIRFLEKLNGKISLVVIDSFNSYYRRLYNSKPSLAKSMLNSQLKILKDLSSNVNIILTNQVFDDMKGNFQGVGGYFTDKFSDEIIRLQKEPRTWTKNKETKKFEIISSGILFS